MADGNQSTRQSEGQWHLDKRIPIALIVTLAMQGAVGIAWMSTLGERVNAIERGVIARATQGDRLTRVEVKVDGLVETTSEIKRLLQSPMVPR